MWEEEILAECRMLILNVALQVDIADVWNLIPDSQAWYTVRGTYRILTRGTPPNITNTLVSTYLLWRKDVPLKVSIFAWRLFRNRLPTKVNLFRRGIISNEA